MEVPVTAQKDVYITTTTTITKQWKKKVNTKFFFFAVYINWMRGEKWKLSQLLTTHAYLWDEEESEVFIFLFTPPAPECSAEEKLNLLNLYPPSSGTVIHPRFHLIPISSLKHTHK